MFHATTVVCQPPQRVTMSARPYVIAFSRISDDEQKTYCFYYCFYSVKTNLLDPSSSILHRIVFYALSNRMFHIFCRIVSLARNTYKTAVITISIYTRVYQSRFIANVYGNINWCRFPRIRRPFNATRVKMSINALDPLSFWFPYVIVIGLLHCTIRVNLSS